MIICTGTHITGTHITDNIYIYRHDQIHTCSQNSAFAQRLTPEKSGGGRKVWYANCHQPCGDHARSCFTWLSRASALARSAPRSVPALQTGKRAYVQKRQILEKLKGFWILITDCTHQNHPPNSPPAPPPPPPPTHTHTHIFFFFNLFSFSNNILLETIHNAIR